MTWPQRSIISIGYVLFMGAMLPRYDPAGQARNFNLFFEKQEIRRFCPHKPNFMGAIRLKRTMGFIEVNQAVSGTIVGQHLISSL